MQNVTDVIIATCRSQTAVEVVNLVKMITKTAGMEVQVHSTCLNACASKNRNKGLDLSSSLIQIMVDDDITGLPHGWVFGLVDLMERHPKCVMSSPQLMNLNGSFGFMLGYPSKHRDGESIVELQELPTACIAIRKNDLRFDESFVGSGWEDTDYCAQLRKAYPDGTWILSHDIQVIHIHEMKNQQPHFERNKAIYLAKWGKLQGE